jgi:flagellar motor switch protein FliM
MIEPIRALLDAYGSDSDESDVQWKLALRHEVLGAKVGINSILVEKTLSIRDILQFKKGDIIPIDMPKTVLIKVEGVPVFTGSACESEGYYAVQILNKV